MTRTRNMIVPITALSALACAVGLTLDPRTMLVAYLAAAVTTVSIPVGALGVLLVTYLVPGRWTTELHPILSRGALLVPTGALLMLPVLIGVKVIYPWAGYSEPDKGFQAVYLTPWFFILRTMVYFIVLSVIAHWAVRAYRRPEARTRSASAGIIVYALLVSFAGIDWLESVEPAFHSSIYGLLFLTIVLLTGLAFALVAKLATAQRASVKVYGPLLLSMLLVWAYHHAMQYIIIWAGNLPNEMIWYVERLDGGWAVLLWALFTLQFIAPFIALLSERVRNGRRAILLIATGTLALRYLEAAVLALPPLHVETSLLWLDIPAAILFTGGLFVVGWFAPLAVSAPRSATV